MANKNRMIVLLNLSKWDSPKKPGCGFTLDVVHEVDDTNKSWGIGVERAWFMEGGAKRIPKKMERRDFKTCAEKWPQVLALFENPPALPEVQAPPASQPIDGGIFG